jgi:transposase
MVITKMYKLEPMKQVTYTIKRHWDGLIQWKTSRINNGLLEELDSAVQAPTRQAHEYKLKYFKTIAYLITSNMYFSNMNKVCTR